VRTTATLAFAGFSMLAATGLAHAQPVTYQIDPRHTFVTFEIGHRIGNVDLSTSRGRWDKKEGTVQFDAAAKTGKVELTIDMASISTGTPGFDNHLRGGDFFEVEKHPQGKFVGDRFVFNGDTLAEVAGQLTLKGQTQPVTLKALRFGCVENPMLKREVCGGDFEAVIDRTAFGIDFGLARGVSKEVKLAIQVEAIRQE
jgi:polyisoprenoid-binding protein YceI